MLLVSRHKLSAICFVMQPYHIPSPEARQQNQSELSNSLCKTNKKFDHRYPFDSIVTVFGERKEVLSCNMTNIFL